jgi:glycosyltransferase involved in cell wall biosynthesis
LEGLDENDKEAIISVTEARQVDVVVFNRNISFRFNPSPIFATLKKAGVKIIMDLDDHWDISPGHPLYSYARKTNFAKCCIDQLKYSDYITCTHAHLKKQIVEIGIPKEKVFICRNAIDPSEAQYNQEFKYGDKLMWQGSSTHAMDLELLKLIEQPITLCGYHYSEEWFEMTSKIKKPLIKDHLPVSEYMNFYKGLGISLIPLKDNKFNKNKSELKMIEAGWAKKAVIVSDVHPYSLLAEHGINSFTAKTPSDFKKYTDLLINTPSLQDELRGKLHEDILQRYLIDTPNERRLEILWKCQKD